MCAQFVKPRCEVEPEETHGVNKMGQGEKLKRKERKEYNRDLLRKTNIKK